MATGLHLSETDTLQQSFRSILSPPFPAHNGIQAFLTILQVSMTETSLNPLTLRHKTMDKKTETR